MNATGGDKGGLLAVHALLDHCRLVPGEIRHIQPCGAGGQFVCYQVDLQCGTRWCVKLEKHSGTTTHLHREGCFLGLLRSRHVPRLLLDASAEGLVIEEWIEGIPLEQAGKDRLRAGLGRIVLSLAELLEDLASVMPAVVHRDIKPRNLVLRQGEVVLLDFGSAEREGSRTSCSPAQHRKLGRGTHVFQPLEQLLGRPTQDRRADVFAAAGVVFWILMDSPPFDNTRSDVAEALRHYQSRERQIDALLGHWPGPLREALVSALRVDPEERSVDLADLARAIASVQA